MAVTIIWQSDIVTRNSNERYKVGTWYEDGVERGTCEVPLNDDDTQKMSDSRIIQSLEAQLNIAS